MIPTKVTNYQRMDRRCRVADPLISSEGDWGMSEPLREVSKAGREGRFCRIELSGEVQTVTK